MLAVSTHLHVRSKGIGKSFNFESIQRRSLSKTIIRLKCLIEIKNRLQQTVSLNAPKSERISQHHLESTQPEVHEPVVKPSAEPARVVRGRGAVALQMSLRTFTKACAEKLRKTSEPRK